MAGKLINEESVIDVNRKMGVFVEESRQLLLELEKALDLAEMEGWRDKNYNMIQDQFTVAKKNIKDGLDELEDMSMPIIKELMKDIEY